MAGAPLPDDANPCVSCGACCAAFRVSFHWLEGEEAGGAVPAALTEPLPPHRLCMRGTNSDSPRCAALEGEVGEHVHCTIYDKRSTTCRKFEPGPASEACVTARAKYGLRPLDALL